MAGVVGAIFNSACQLGSAVGIAAVTSISTNIENRDGPAGFFEFKGRADSFWFLFASVTASMISVVIFYKPDRRAVDLVEEEKAAVVV